MAEPLGFAHYRDSYTDEQLWDMLVTQGNPTSINLSTSIWSTARGSTASAREALNTHLAELAEYWKGPASDEFQSRMALVIQYAVAAEQRMSLAENTYLPDLAGKLAAAQSQAKGDNALGENLDPATDITDPEVWMEEVKGLSREQIAALDPQTRTTYNNQHAAWRQSRHDELARTVADLGTQYADYTNGVFAEPPEPAPEGMPGNDTYQQPTTGVFAPTTADTSASTGSDTSASGGNPGSLQPEPPLVDDEDDVAGPWDLPSYDDIDEPDGGLASGGTAPTAPVGGAGPVGGTPATGGGTLPTGGGLFPGRTTPGTSGLPGRGTGSVPGRGPATTGPARGAQPTTPGRGGQPGTSGRGTSGRGSQPGTPGRGGSTAGRGGHPGTPGRSSTTAGRGGQPGSLGRNGTAGHPGQPGAPGSRNTAGPNSNGKRRGAGTRAGAGAGASKHGSPGANSKRRNDEAEEEETLTRETKYVTAEDVFSAPFDPSVGPAHEGAKHQRAWNKEYDAWKRRQEEDGGNGRS
jgi:uncharacterized protein YukE